MCTSPYFCYASLLKTQVVGVISGAVLPHLAGRDRRLLGRKTDVDEDAEISRLRGTVRKWKVDAARQGKPLKLPVMPFLLRNIWTGALLLFTFLTFMTFFVETVAQVSRKPRIISLTLTLVPRRIGNRLYLPRRDIMGSRCMGALCDHHGGKE